MITESAEFRNNNYEHVNDLNMPPHHNQSHHHHHHHHFHNPHQIHHQSSEELNVPKLEPPSTPPLLTSTDDNNPIVICAGCGIKISDRFYLQAVDRRWHISCLQCSHCRQGLDGEITCFSRDGNIYCKKDYYR